MAEQNSSAQEKTEEASQQKLKKSRDQGQVARSKDLATSVSLLVTMLVLKFSAMYFYEGLQQSFRLAYLNFNHSEMGLEDLQIILGHNLMIFVQMLAPLLLTSLFVVVLGLIPGGWVFASENFRPKLSKLNPITGLGRIFSAQNWTELAKSLLKIAVLLTVAWFQINYALPELLALQRSDVYSALSGAFTITFDMIMVLLTVFIVFAVIDIPLQRFFFLKKMRMTKQERKEEHKNQEGRPEIKAKIKQLQRQMLHRQINTVIKQADVVITNPQHFAVALKYDQKKAEAPYVLAKGVDETALHIRSQAQAHALEVIELPPLARAIYFTTQVNQQIPAPLYTAVAHVLTYVLQLKAYRQGRRRRKPVLSEDINIPAQLSERP